MKRHFFFKTPDWSFLEFWVLLQMLNFHSLGLEMSQVKCKKSFLGNSNSQPWPLSPSFVMIEGKSHSQTFCNCLIHCNDPRQEKKRLAWLQKVQTQLHFLPVERRLWVWNACKILFWTRVKNFVLTEMIKANVFLLHIFLHTLNIFGGWARNENEDIISAEHHIPLTLNNGTL